MDDNKNQNQPNQTAADYQKILDEYAASIKPESAPDSPILEEEKIIKLDEVKDNLQLESPIHPSLAANLETEDDYQKPFSIPPIPPQEIVKTPEEIKAEVDKILADDSPKSSKLNFIKILFIISLIIFLGIVGVIVYTLLQNSSTSDQKTDSNQSSTITPTSVVSDGSCELDDNVYQIGESFASADGCNTCTCKSAEVITCTQKTCTATPTSKTTITPTKSVTVSPTKTTVTPTKVATPTKEQIPELGESE